tara:strand:- start:1276 stop:1407 length:132 start_codon:yes stop_codon:yes gene_type:complete
MIQRKLNVFTTAVVTNAAREFSSPPVARNSALSLESPVTTSEI